MYFGAHKSRETCKHKSLSIPIVVVHMGEFNTEAMECIMIESHSQLGESHHEETVISRLHTWIHMSRCFSTSTTWSVPRYVRC